MAAPSIGSTLLERYRIEDEARKSESGVVFHAVEIATGRDVALEIATLLESDGARNELVRDAKIAQRLEGEHVVRVFDAGVLSDGVPYVVREPWIGGLDDEVEARGPIPVTEAVGWTLEILEVLAEAHAIGMAHGDVGPANAVLARDDDGNPVAKLVWTTAAKAKRVAREDARRDIAGAACLLRFLLTGAEDPEFEGAKTLPTDLAYAIAKGVSAGDDEGTYFANVADFASAIARYAPEGHGSARNIRFVLSRAGIASPIASPSTSTQRVAVETTTPPKRVARRAFSAVLFAAGGTAALVVFALMSRQPPPPLAPTLAEPVSTTNLTSAEGVSSALVMTPPRALSSDAIPPPKVQASVPTAPKTESARVPGEVIELDDEPATTAPPQVAPPRAPEPTSSPDVPHPASPTAPAETVDPLR